MRVGNVVVVKVDNGLLGEVIAIDDYDRATVKLNDSGAEIVIDLCYLEEAKEAGCDG